MADTLSEIGERIHRKSHEYFVFDFSRREQEKWNMFYGATDALLDAGTAAASYSRAIAHDKGINLLVCYGFLQALYVQQDAVQILSRSVGLDWRPDEDGRLKEIRDARNRITGHPARAGEKQKPPRPSSAIIPYGDITQRGFRGHVYYEDGVEDIDIDVPSFLRDNEKHLAIQMKKIEKKMDKDEREFRKDQSTRPLSACFENNFSYLLRRLHCNLSDRGRVVQAQSHAQMMRKTISSLQEELTERGFQAELISLHLGRIFRGLDLLERIMSKGSSTKDKQYEFDLLYDGVENNIKMLKQIVSEFDEKLRSTVP